MLKRYTSHIVLLAACSVPHSRIWAQPLKKTVQMPAKSARFSAMELKAFSSLHPIDAHTHIYVTAPEYLAMLSRLRLHALDIMVV